MGFKWFKARMKMNRMPANSTAVAGTYRSMAIDEFNDGFISNTNQRNYDHMKVEPKPNTRPISMPNWNNPMVEITNGDDAREFARPSNTEISRSLSISILETSEHGKESMNKGSEVGELGLVMNDELQQDLSENIAQRTPRPAPKMKNNNYKKKKFKAPAPKINLSMNNDTTSGNSNDEFIMLKNRSDTDA